ncbi:putative Mir domain superfamily protein [Helianthus annuus]|nr:putative Mir domain superfamily protein [Helianthus annuus]
MTTSSFFGLAILLFLTLHSDTVYAATSEGVKITYGSVIKLMHERTKFRLHSHNVPYGSGSGQQSVTSFRNVDDANSYWIVRPEPDTYVKPGDNIKSGSVIRLQHMRTRKWLHSHLHASPISGNLEVSGQNGFGLTWIIFSTCLNMPGLVDPQTLYSLLRLKFKCYTYTR